MQIMGIKKQRSQVSCQLELLPSKVFNDSNHSAVVTVSSGVVAQSGRASLSFCIGNGVRKDMTSASVHIADSCTNEETHLGTNNEKLETQAKKIMRYLFSMSFTLEE